ncbi:hypothetical protein C8R44DRAFT_893631 [Mycena epipterygia]|nr:hypothetical protein C8R44DRAFT_893631 [Mycena epipterygia]
MLPCAYRRVHHLRCIHPGEGTQARPRYTRLRRANEPTSGAQIGNGKDMASRIGPSHRPPLPDTRGEAAPTAYPRIASAPAADMETIAPPVLRRRTCVLRYRDHREHHDVAQAIPAAYRPHKPLHPHWRRRPAPCAHPRTRSPQAHSPRTRTRLAPHADDADQPSMCTSASTPRPPPKLAPVRRSPTPPRADSYTDLPATDVRPRACSALLPKRGQVRILSGTETAGTYSSHPAYNSRDAASTPAPSKQYRSARSPRRAAHAAATPARLLRVDTATQAHTGKEKKEK